MNKNQYIAPALALVIVAAWHIYLRASTTSIISDNIEHEKILRSSGNPSDALGANARTKKTQEASSDAPVASKASSNTINTPRDWKSLFRILSGEVKDSGITKHKAKEELKSLIPKMGKDELMAAHLDVKGLPSSAPGRYYLEGAILENLELHHPEYAFSQYSANENTDGLSRFHRWLTRDPAAAMAWYESEVAKGMFDKTLGDNLNLRHTFEASFITSLLTTDPAAAESRMNQIPPEQRYWFALQRFERSETDPKALADLIRKTISKNDQAGLIVIKTLDQDHLDDTAKVVERLSYINATQEERYALLQTVASKGLNFKTFDSNSMKQYREWSLAIDPSSADRTTGLAFAQHANSFNNIDYITKLANNYHSLGAGDDFIIGFLVVSESRRTEIPLDTAREFAMKIQDQTRRNEILQNLK